MKKKKKSKRFREWFLEKCKLPFAQATVLRHEAPPYTIQADQNRYLIFVNRMFVNIDRAKARYAGRIGFLTSKKRQPPDSFFLSFFLSSSPLDGSQPRVLLLEPFPPEERLFSRFFRGLIDFLEHV